MRHNTLHTPLGYPGVCHNFDDGAWTWGAAHPARIVAVTGQFSTGTRITRKKARSHWILHRFYPGK